MANDDSEGAASAGVAVCVTGLARSFDAAAASNIRRSVLSPLLSRSSVQQLRIFGIRPANDSWLHVLSHLVPHELETQRSCPAAISLAPAWYTCQRGGAATAASGHERCAHNFVQELCDLRACEGLLRRHERRAGATFELAARVRLDLVRELLMGSRVGVEGRGREGRGREGRGIGFLRVRSSP